MHRHPFRHHSAIGSAVGIGLVSAALAAGAVYYLYATESGEKARAKIHEAAGNAKDKALDIKDKKDNIQEILSSHWDDVREDIQGMISEAVAKAKE